MTQMAFALEVVHPMARVVIVHGDGTRVRVSGRIPKAQAQARLAVLTRKNIHDTYELEES